MSNNLFAAAQALREKTNNQNNPQTIPVNTANIYPNYPYPNQSVPQQGIMKILQTAIISERKAQKLTQRQLAKMAHMSQGTITRAEVHGWVSLNTMFRIVEALGQTIQVIKA